MSNLLITSVVPISTFAPTMRKTQDSSGNKALDSEDMKYNANDKYQNEKRCRPHLERWRIHNPPQLYSAICINALRKDKQRCISTKSER